MICCLIIINPKFSKHLRTIQDLLQKNLKEEGFQLKKKINTRLNSKQIKEFCEPRDLEKENLVVNGEIRGFIVTGEKIVTKIQSMLRIHEILKRLSTQDKTSLGEFAYYSTSVSSGLEDSLFFIPGKDLV